MSVPKMGASTSTAPQSTNGTEPPTVDRFRADINRPLTGKRMAFVDLAAAPLGTDDEAAGTPASRAERLLEDMTRPAPRKPSEPWDGAAITYIALIVTIGVVLLVPSVWPR